MINIDNLMDMVIELMAKKSGHTVILRNILKDVGEDKSARIRFLTVLKNNIRDVPLEVYPEDQNRENLLDAIQKVLDQEIKEEEEQEEEEFQ